ncbi:MAG: hypothetical protein ACOC57_02690 [Acidobacteriota bacterium]
MKKQLALPILFIIVFIFPQISLSQQEQETTAFPQLKTEAGKQIYEPEGRRDPFRDLLAGRDIREKTAITGTHQMSIDDTVLIGIVKARGEYTAIINGPQEFPYYIKSGDQFEDGFVLSIEESKVVFRKTRERDIPLMRPKDITKEINPQEK